MGSDEEYIQYGIELSLAVAGVAASYFIDFSFPITFATLLFMPVLFGYTAYISRDRFNKASLTSLTALIFVLVGGITALTALLYSVGNVMVSMFSSGTGFKDFYSATSLPLLIVGVLIGASVYGYGAYNPDFKQEKLNQTSQQIGGLAQDTFGNSEIIESQRRAQIRTVNLTARNAVLLTTQKVINRSNPSNEVRVALMDAETEVPQEIYERTRAEMSSRQPDISNRVSNVFMENFSGSNFLLVIPILAGFFYSMQPLIGVLTGLFGSIFIRMGN